MGKFYFITSPKNPPNNIKPIHSHIEFNGKLPEIIIDRNSRCLPKIFFDIDEPSFSGTMWDLYKRCTEVSHRNITVRNEEMVITGYYYSVAKRIFIHKAVSIDAHNPNDIEPVTKKGKIHIGDY
ncbi:hypothetical protein RF11_07623 [Thelohanellus kitauei]|uniref:Uncharacterized protein n=1 Tax=Thelohanellus kitauei TaxID=669202 RepID=A0A0C2JBG4_THEKT|nr:hypothetical protein RF11_07623 [Thelohanellus kitauei]